MIRRRRAAPGLLPLLVSLVPGPGPAPAAAQPDWLAGYVLTVPVVSAGAFGAETDASQFTRLRLTTEPVRGAFAFEAAYEHAVTVRRRDGPAGLGIGGLSGVQSGGEWFDLQGTITGRDGGHVRWQHRFDRFSAAWTPTEAVELTVGRQAVSWGTTQFLTPADPFSAFDPTDPFRVFRAGVDAARLRIFPGPLSEVDVVVRPTRTAAGDELTALARGLTTWRNWGLSAWGGTLYGDLAGAVGATGGLGPWAVSVEAVVRDVDGTVVGRGAVGAFRLFQAGGRDLSVSAEYLRDGLGAAGPDEVEAVLASRAFLRGEHQVVGRDEAAVTVAYQIDPLWSLNGFALWNLNDRSAIVAPSVTWSVSDEASLAGGVYGGVGDRTPEPDQRVPSVYGGAGVTAYLSLTWFF